MFFTRILVISAATGLLVGGCPLGLNEPFDLAPSGPVLNSDPAPRLTAGIDSAPAIPADIFNRELAQQFPTCDTPAQLINWQDQILELVNDARAENGIGPVVWSDRLEQQATQYACEMIHYDFFDHVNPVTQSTLIDRARDFEYDFLVIGENLAAGQRTPREAFDDWMASPGHRKNILDARFDELGIGIRTGGTYGTYWVQEFGLPAP